MACHVTRLHPTLRGFITSSRSSDAWLAHGCLRCDDPHGLLSLQVEMTPLHSRERLSHSTRHYIHGNLRFGTWFGMIWKVDTVIRTLSFKGVLDRLQLFGTIATASILGSQPAFVKAGRGLVLRHHEFAIRSWGAWKALKRWTFESPMKKKHLKLPILYSFPRYICIKFMQMWYVYYVYRIHIYIHIHVKCYASEYTHIIILYIFTYIYIYLHLWFEPFVATVVPLVISTPVTFAEPFKGWAPSHVQFLRKKFLEAIEKQISRSFPWKCWENCSLESKILLSCFEDVMFSETEKRVDDPRRDLKVAGHWRRRRRAWQEGLLQSLCRTSGRQVGCKLGEQAIESQKSGILRIFRTLQYSRACDHTWIPQNVGLGLNFIKPSSNLFLYLAVSFLKKNFSSFHHFHRLSRMTAPRSCRAPSRSRPFGCSMPMAPGSCTLDRLDSVGVGLLDVVGRGRVDKKW